MTTVRTFFLFVFLLGAHHASAIATRFFGRGSRSANVPVVPTNTDNYQVVITETCDDEVDTATSASPSTILEALDQEIAKLNDKKASALRHARERAPGVVDDPALKVVFLKANKGDPVAAAKQYAAYWKNRVQLFGEHAYVSNLEHAFHENNHDRQALQYGHIRTLPDNDQVLVMDLSRIPKKYNFDSVARATMHVMMKAIQKSQRMQDHGVLFVVDVGNIRHFDYQWMKLAQYTGAQAFPARTAGYCIANLSPSAALWAKRIFMPFLGKEQKQVFQMASNAAELKKCIGVESLD